MVLASPVQAGTTYSQHRTPRERPQRRMDGRDVRWRIVMERGAARLGKVLSVDRGGDDWLGHR